MSAFVVVPPEPLVTVPDAKQHLRETDDENDTYIEALIAAAQAHIDGPQGWLGAAIGRQTLEIRRCSLTGDVCLPYPPIISITSVKYDDAGGVEQTLSADTYRLVGTPSAPRLALSYGASWPSVRYGEDAVRIQYEAGYETVPAAVQHAILLMVGEWYSQREDAAEAARVTIPLSAQALLAPFRVWSV